MAKVDAIHQPRRQAMNPSTVIDEQVLERLEMDMDKFERVSCLFLIIEDYKHGYKALIDHEKHSTTMISNFINKNKIADWHDKIIEALCLMQNHEILLNLGISPDDAKVKFATHISNLTYKINKYAKALYCLFDHLSNDDVSNILARVYQEFPRPDTCTWPDKNSLEFHMLWWVQEGFVDISTDKWKLSKVLNILKALELTTTDAYETLKSYDSEDNEPCRYDDQSNNKLSVKDSAEEDNVTRMPKKSDDCYIIHTGLTIIFNQMKFAESTNYEYRSGSEVDCERIRKIFKETFRFEVEVYNDSDCKKIYNILDKSCHGKKYDCVVVFILSHGTLGNVIASDGVECPINEIQDKMCTGALDGKPKMLVIQACQSRALTTDGPVRSRNEKNLNRFRDFILLSSTIPDQPSMRDCQKGTWYIQKLCDVLEMSGQDCCIVDCAQEVNKRISSLQGEIGGSMIEQVSTFAVTLVKKLVLPKRTHRAANASCN